MNLKDIRKAKNYSQQKLARKMLVSQQSVAKWETGKSNPRAEYLPKLADILGCTIDELLRNEENKTQERGKERKLK